MTVARNIVSSQYLADVLGIKRARINQIARKNNIIGFQGKGNLVYFTKRQAEHLKEMFSPRFPNRYVGEVIYVQETYWIIPSRLNFM